MTENGSKPTRANAHLLRHKRSDDVVEARIASQRVPERIETQITVGNVAPWQLDCLTQSFNCAIILACPRINDSEVLNEHRAVDGAFRSRRQLDRALTFADGVFLISQRGIHNAKRAECRRILGLVAHNLLEFSSSLGKRRTSRWLIPPKPGDKPLAPTVRKHDAFVAAATHRHCRQCALGSCHVALE